MKKIIGIFAVLFAFAATSFAQDITGTWVNFDDEDGKKKAHITIYESDGLYYAKIVKILDPTKQDVTCDKCKGDRKGEKTLGMVILTGLEETADGEYRNGQILKPTNGKLYKCKIFVLEEGQALKVMGGLGGPLWKSQRWERVN